MTQAGGFDVDCDELRALASTAGDLGGDGDVPVSDVEAGLQRVATGVPGSQSAAAATEAQPVWTRWIRGLYDELDLIGRRLDETADNYCAVDEAIGGQLSPGDAPGGGIPGVPGGGYVPPHVDPPGQ